MESWDGGRLRIDADEIRGVGRGDVGCHVSWRGERIRLKAGHSQTVMAVRVDMDGVPHSGDMTWGGQRRLAFVAFARLLSDLGIRNPEEARACIEPLAAWMDDQGCANLRYAARGRHAGPSSALHLKPTKALPHVIVPFDARFMTRADLTECMDAIAPLPKRIEPEPRVAGSLIRMLPAWAILPILVMVSSVSAMFAVLAAAILYGSAVVVDHVLLRRRHAETIRRGRTGRATPEILVAEAIRRMTSEYHPDMSEQVLDALASCESLTRASEDSIDPQVIETNAMIGRNMRLLMEDHARAVASANEDEASRYAATACSAIIDLGRHAERTRASIVASAGSDLETRARFLRMKTGGVEDGPLEAIRS